MAADFRSRPRHASLNADDAPQSPTHRRTMPIFPTETTHQMFVSTDGWATSPTLPNGSSERHTIDWLSSENINRTPATPSDGGGSVLKTISTFGQRWTWKHYLAAGIILLLIVSLVVTAIVLICVLPRGNNISPQNIYSTTQTPATATYSAYATGYIRSLQLNIFKTDKIIETLTPVANSSSLFVGVAGDELLLFNATSARIRTARAQMQRGAAARCALLYANAGCFVAGAVCADPEMVYCCEADNSTAGSERCSVGGEVYSDFGRLSAYFVDGAAALHFATINSIDDSLVKYQRHEVESRRQHQGCDQLAFFKDERVVAAAAGLSPDSCGVDLLAAATADRDLVLRLSNVSCEQTCSEAATADIVLRGFLPPQLALVDLAVGYAEAAFNVAATYQSRFYLLHLARGRLQVLENDFFAVQFDAGLIQASFWTGGRFNFWYVLDGEVGVATFEVAWPA